MTSYQDFQVEIELERICSSGLTALPASVTCTGFLQFQLFRVVQKSHSTIQDFLQTQIWDSVKLANMWN